MKGNLHKNNNKRNKSWTGWKSCIPPEGAVLEELEKRDIFLYFGHGGGEQYVSIHKVQKLSSCSTALLMGCSSGKIHDAGNFNSWGTAISYMQAGSAAVVASLWDVTDRDLDRFSEEMLQQWGLTNAQDSSKSLTEAVSISREACYLKYLVGAAIVVYGCPVFLKNPRISKSNDPIELQT